LDASDEAGFSRFVTTSRFGLFHLEASARSGESLAGSEGFPGYDVDCAKLLSAASYYAGRREPFSYVDGVAGSRFGHTANASSAVLGD